MAKVKNPILFSKFFGVDPAFFEDAGLIDPFINVDTQLFIDPVLLSKSGHDVIRLEADQAFRSHFQNFVRLLVISRERRDAAWRAAERLLDLHEPPENGLGYGSSGRSGSSRPDQVKDAILRTAKEIVDLGSRDPEMISLMGFFEDDVGPDTISDFTTRVIVPQLSKITEAFCRAHGVPTRRRSEADEFSLPHYLDRTGVERPAVLVPRDIVRELPVANDWSSIEAAASANAKIRERVNRYLGGIARPTVTERKAALRSAAMESAEIFDTFLRSVKEIAENYDENKDALGYYKIRQILGDNLSQFNTGVTYNIAEGPHKIIEVVNKTIEMFKHHVEKGNLWEELWIDGKPKRERAAQLIYFAIADCFCMANNVDISPEANMGGGPIDFKFSKGYAARVLVEMKRSGGTVVHGYEKQLEYYKDAARTFHGIFVIVDHGDLGGKLAKIQEIRARRLEAGQPASDIVIIDARPKASASKRQS